MSRPEPQPESPPEAQPPNGAAAAPQRAALLINMGTPAGPDTAAVRAYLREFLRDPFVIRWPEALRPLLPALSAWIASRRAPRSAKLYEAIWEEAGSPLKTITERQCRALAGRLGRKWTVRYAMRYGSPSIGDVLGELAGAGVNDLVVVPMYPQWAGPSSGSALDRVYSEIRRQGLALGVQVHADWHNDRGYVEAQARRIRRFAALRELTPRNAYLLFSGHSMPVAYIRDGDPYEDQLRASAELVRRCLGWPEERCGLSFQSRMGPVAWLGPSTPETLGQLAKQGEKDVIVCPLSFTADCLETLHELDVEQAEVFAETSQGGTLHRVPALNDDDGFIDALALLLRRGPRRIALSDVAAAPSTSVGGEPQRARLKRLVMAGFYVGTPDQAMSSGAVDEGQLQQIRQHFSGGPAALLDQCRADASIDGAVLLATCQRFELYALAHPQSHAAEVSEAIRTQFIEAACVEPQTRHGSAAYLHFLEAAAGLQSMAPGDADVLEQIGTARHLAAEAGTLSPSVAHLIGDAAHVIAALREDTAWGRFTLSFAGAALGQLDVPYDPAAMHAVLVGGSATSRQLLRYLASEHGSLGPSVSFVYRGLHRRDIVKFIRRTAPAVRRLRVGTYDSPEALACVGGADVVFLGLSCPHPVWQAAHISGLRDFTARPLTILDFNSNGSTHGLNAIKGVRVITEAELRAAARNYGRRTAKTLAFQQARDEAQRYLQTAVCTADWDPERKDCAHGPCASCKDRAARDVRERDDQGASACAT